MPGQIVPCPPRIPSCGVAHSAYRRFGVREIGEAPLVLENELANFFRHRGDEGPNLKGGKAVKCGCRGGHRLCTSVARKIGRKPRSSALDGLGDSPQFKKTPQRRRRPFQAVHGRAPCGRKGRPRPARTVAKRSPNARGRRRRGVVSHDSKRGNKPPSKISRSACLLPVSDKTIDQFKVLCLPGLRGFLNILAWRSKH